MNLRSGLPFWLLKTGLPFDYPKLEQPTRTDILILGGGISGALIARQLALAGMDCLLADARSIGLGSTCAATAMLQYELDIPLHKLIGILGEPRAQQAYRACVTAVEDLCSLAKKIGFAELEKRPALFFAANKKDETLIQKEYLARKKASIAVRHFDAPACEDYCGIRHAAIRSECGAQTNAYAFTHALLQDAMKKGLRVFDRSLLQNIQHDKNGISAFTENGARIRAKKIIYATGYESLQYVQDLPVKIHSSYSCISEQIPGDAPFWKDEMILWNSADPYLYMRCTKDRRIIVGGRDVPYYDPRKRDALIAQKTQRLSADLHRLFPHIPFRPEFSWCGSFGLSPDSLPYIGVLPKFPNAYFAMGFGGNGITFSQIAAGILHDLILRKRNPDSELFSFSR